MLGCSVLGLGVLVAALIACRLVRRKIDDTFRGFR